MRFSCFSLARTEHVFVVFRRESNRTGCGPQAGAEGVRRGVGLPAEACGSVSEQCQDLLDRELNT